jgi:site-specific DNA-methyltransferase (adenine-specific)
MSRVEHLAEGVTLHLGDCLEVLPTLGKVGHIICDPPYEASLHDSKNKLRARLRSDGGPDLKGLEFAPIDAIRARVVEMAAAACEGWFLAFCTVEGTWEWAAAINASPMKYKRACAWVKPDSTPQLNGQGPAQGYECFVAAWAGTGQAKWNSGGKRGVYTHLVNYGRQGEHPTEKPVPLMSELISDFTQIGDLICDPFCGSGSTGVAAVKAGRQFVGIEQDPKWFDLSCRRIAQALTQGDMFVAPPKPMKQEALPL